MRSDISSETRRKYVPVGLSPASLRAPGTSGTFPHPCGSSMLVTVSEEIPDLILRYYRNHKI